MKKTRGVKPPYIEWHLLEKVNKHISSGSKAPLRTKSRRSVILQRFVGINFEIHNGKKFVPVFINDTMIGHKLGEFAPTRTFKGHSGDRKKSR